MGNELQKKRLKIKMPHIFVLLTGMIFIAAILSWILPAGEFDRAPNAAGRTVVVPGTYHHVDPTPVGPFKALMAIFDGLVNAADIVFFIFIAFSSIGILLASGAFHGLVAGLLRVLKGNARLAIIPIFFAVLGLASSTIGVFEEAIPFIPIFVGIAIGMGYDAVVGLAIVAVGVGMGYSGAVMNPFTVGVAQGIAELPPLSGGVYRVICHLAMITVGSIYTIRYALKVQKDPTKSLVYGEDFSKFTVDEKSIAEHPFGIRQKLSLAVFFITLGIFVWGVKIQGWYFGEIATVFLLMAIVISIIMGWTPNELANKIAGGLNEICTACMMVGIARGIKVVLDKGHIIDTIVYGMSIPLAHLPKWVAGEAMLFVQSIIGFIIPSGSGQAATSMPIMVPLADVLGLTPQVAVLAFQFADGFTNIVYPTAFAVVMSGIAGIKVTTWWKWLLPLFGWIYLTQMVLMAVAIGIGYR